MLKNTYVLVADGSRARLFQSSPHFEDMTLVREFDHAASRERDADLVTDRPGRAQKGMSASSRRTALEPTASPHEKEMEHFADELFGALNDYVDETAGHRLIVVAAPHFLGLLRKRLHTGMGAKLAATLDKDLTGLAPDALEEALRRHLL